MGLFPASAYCRSSCLTSWSLNNASVRHPTSTPWATLSIRSGPTWPQARADLARMRERTLGLDASRAATPSPPSTWRGRCTSAPGPWSTTRDRAVLRPARPTHSERRALVHRPPARRRRPSGDPRRRRLAGRRLARLLPRHAAPSRWASSCGAGSASTAGSITAYEDEHLSTRRETDRAQRDPRRRDRAPARRADARHRRDDPAGAGRDRPGRTSATTVCVQGAPGHRQDRRRPAPRCLPALRPPGPAAPAPACSSSGRTARS